jgi:hypothetical protein
MSIFDPESGFDPLPWLQEKTLDCLVESARLVDLANEPDTNAWYAKTLRSRASRLVGRLAPIVALLHRAGAEAAASEAWQPVLNGGSFALAAWCKKWQISDPATAGFGAVASAPDEAEAEPKSEALEPGLAEVDEATSLGIRLDIYGAFSRRLVHETLTESERRLVMWLLAELWHSPLPDIAVVSKRFLPTDIGCTAEETAVAYRSLYERGVIERVDGLPDLSETALALRLIDEGTNESRHPAAYREETFGFPGARVNGQPTLGNLLHVGVPDRLWTALERWRPQVTADDLTALATHLQERIGTDRVFIEAVELGSSRGLPEIVVRLRYGWDEDDLELQARLAEATEHWLRGQLVR